MIDELWMMWDIDQHENVIGSVCMLHIWQHLPSTKTQMLA